MLWLTRLDMGILAGRWLVLVRTTKRNTRTDFKLLVRYSWVRAIRIVVFGWRPDAARNGFSEKNPFRDLRLRS
ncbi:hypothetical protein [Azospirillum sp.]|uniref:hypothetical protein n=1 Tax=Azospirillum sp. TaxID=34012 RepID=UPI002D3DBC3A|nr:hypothetical protein [Azospirillum sp.]HYD67127.1 hypothetical protein [Azospirillum sp.]